MKFIYALNKLYYENRLYIFFGIFQLALSFSLFFYLLADFKQHFREKHVLQVEIAIFGLMSLDCLVYHMVHGLRFSLLSLLEFFILAGFGTCFAVIFLHGVQTTNEEVELALIVLRFALQGFRLVLLVARMRENQSKRNSNTDLEITDNCSSGFKDSNSVANFEIAV